MLQIVAYKCKETRATTLNSFGRFPLCSSFQLHGTWKSHFRINHALKSTITFSKCCHKPKKNEANKKEERARAKLSINQLAPAIFCKCFCIIFRKLITSYRGVDYIQPNHIHFVYNVLHCGHFYWPNKLLFLALLSQRAASCSLFFPHQNTTKYIRCKVFRLENSNCKHLPITLLHTIKSIEWRVRFRIELIMGKNCKQAIENVDKVNRMDAYRANKCILNANAWIKTHTLRDHSLLHSFGRHSMREMSEMWSTHCSRDTSTNFWP